MLFSCPISLPQLYSYVFQLTVIYNTSECWKSLMDCPTEKRIYMPSTVKDDTSSTAKVVVPSTVRDAITEFKRELRKLGGISGSECFVLNHAGKLMPEDQKLSPYVQKFRKVRLEITLMP